MESELWVSSYCPSCDTRNWFSCGEVSTGSLDSLNGVCCFSCGETWFLMYDDISELHFEEGVEIP